MPVHLGGLPRTIEFWIDGSVTSCVLLVRGLVGRDACRLLGNAVCVSISDAGKPLCVSICCSLIPCH